MKYHLQSKQRHITEEFRQEVQYGEISCLRTQIEVESLNQTVNISSWQAQCEEFSRFRVLLLKLLQSPRRGEAAGESFKVLALKLQESVTPGGLKLLQTHHFHTTLVSSSGYYCHRPDRLHLYRPDNTLLDQVGLKVVLQDRDRGSSSVLRKGPGVE